MLFLNFALKSVDFDNSWQKIVAFTVYNINRLCYNTKGFSHSAFNSRRAEEVF